MSRKFMTLPALCLSVWLAGCQSAPPPAPPPADTREADEKAIRQLEDEWAAAMAAKDAARFASYYAPDAIVYINGMPAMKGAEAINNGLKQAFADPNFSNRFKTSRVHVAKSGELACTEGDYEGTFTDPKTKKKFADAGSYITCWSKQPDGTWKAVADMTSAAAAPVRAK
jgi:uncharacterized protein (TIGR02246 family)